MFVCFKKKNLFDEKNFCFDLFRQVHDFPQDKEKLAAAAALPTETQAESSSQDTKGNLVSLLSAGPT